MKSGVRKMKSQLKEKLRQKRIGKFRTDHTTRMKDKHPTIHSKMSVPTFAKCV